MTITTEQVALLADQFAGQRDIEANSSAGRALGIPWAWVELAAQVTPTCCQHEPDPGPSYDHVSDRGGNLAPYIDGATSAQCGRCGQLGLNWVTSGARPVDLDANEDVVEELLEEMFAAVDQRRTERLDELVETIRQRLSEDLAGVVDERDSSGELPDWVTRVSYMSEPGVGLEDDGRLVAWDYDPRHPLGTDFIEVSEDPSAVGSDQ
jgi:hypothetical protein